MNANLGTKIFSCPKSSFLFFCKMLRENLGDPLANSMYRDFQDLCLRDMGLKFRNICWPQANPELAMIIWEFSWCSITCSFYNQSSWQFPCGYVNQSTWNKMYLQPKMVPSDEELELGLNSICKIGLKHLIPVSNCFNRRKTFVAMKVPLESQMASSAFTLDPLSWLDDLSNVHESTLNPENASETCKA